MLNLLIVHFMTIFIEILLHLKIISRLELFRGL